MILYHMERTLTQKEQIVPKAEEEAAAPKREIRYPRRNRRSEYLKLRNELCINANLFFFFNCSLLWGGDPLFRLGNVFGKWAVAINMNAVKHGYLSSNFFDP